MAKTAARKNKTTEAPQRTILFGKENYALIVAGLVVVIIGFFLMAGGAQNDPNVWKAEEIYSFRRITLAPMVVLLGLGLVIFSIFKTPSSAPVATSVTEAAPESDEDIIA